MVEDMHIDDQTLEKIKEMHKVKLKIFWLMESSQVETNEDISFLCRCDRLLTEAEFLLQNLWGFSSDACYHKFWERPKCVCPKMDNEDRYPSRNYIISEDCILHSGKYTK